MSYQFYYDALLQEKELTFRLVGQKSKKLKGESSSTVEVILKDFIKSQLSVSISHAYQYGDIGLAQVHENLRTFVADLSNALGRNTNEIIALLTSLGLKSDFFTLSPNDNGGQTINVPPSDYFKVFTGTEISLPLSFNSRLYSRVNEQGILETPKEMLTRILEYVVGDYSTADKDSFTGTAKSPATYFSYGPPHGYNPYTVGGDWKIEGGLTLYYGAQAVIENLLLKDFEYTLSREVDLDGNPIYIDISFTLIPALMFKQSDLASSLDFSNKTNSKELGNSSFTVWKPSSY